MSYPELSAETAPKDGTVFFAVIRVPMRWKAYKPMSEQFRRGIKGRWQRKNEFGGWDNAPFPDEWWSGPETQGGEA